MDGYEALQCCGKARSSPWQLKILHPSCLLLLLLAPIGEGERGLLPLLPQPLVVNNLYTSSMASLIHPAQVGLAEAQ
jgi:hypothetical protein